MQLLSVIFNDRTFFLWEELSRPLLILSSLINHYLFSSFRLFQEPEIDDGEKIEFKFQDPDEAGLIQFLCTEKNFAEERVKNGVKKILAAKSKSKQGRLDSFFKVLPSTTPTASAKRKPDPKGKGKGNASKRGRR